MNEFTAYTLFKARQCIEDLESQLFDFMVELVGLDPLKWLQHNGDDYLPFDDFKYDSYDKSLEFKQCDNNLRLTPDALEKIWNKGFTRVWLCHKNGCETYYSKILKSEDLNKLLLTSKN